MEYIDEIGEYHSTERVLTAEEQKQELFFKLQTSNDFSFTFALLDLEEFLLLNGFETALQVVDAAQLSPKFEKRAFEVLHKYIKNHCTRYENSYEEFCEYLINRWM
jgi:hypothetical protein